MSYNNYREFQCMDVAEQKRGEAFIRELSEKLIETKTNGKGVLASVVNGVISNDYCKIQAGTTAGTLKILDGYFVGKGIASGGSISNNILNSSVILGHAILKDNIVISNLVGRTNGEIAYVVIEPIEYNIEPGTVAIAAASNQITTVGIDFQTLQLRDHSTGAPMKVRFRTSDGAISINNPLDYDIVEITGANTAIISGDHVDETGLSLEIIGSFDLNEQSDLVGKYLYSYIDAKISFVSSIVGLLDWEIPIARLEFLGSSTFNIVDLRLENILSFYTESEGVTLPVTKTSDYTFTEGDNSKLFKSDSANPIVFTIQNDSTYSFPLGANINLMRQGTGSLTISAAGGVIIRFPVTHSGSLRTQYSAASLIKIDANQWLLTGDLTVELYLL